VLHGHSTEIVLDNVDLRLSYLDTVYSFHCLRAEHTGMRISNTEANSTMHFLSDRVATLHYAALFAGIVRSPGYFQYFASDQVFDSVEVQTDRRDPPGAWLRAEHRGDRHTVWEGRRVRLLYPVRGDPHRRDGRLRLPRAEPAARGEDVDDQLQRAREVA
jgi:hypothetical protein